jgi:hypothetical protein
MRADVVDRAARRGMVGAPWGSHRLVLGAVGVAIAALLGSVSVARADDEIAAIDDRDAATVALVLPECLPSWFDRDALIGALRVELAAHGLALAEARGAIEVRLELDCDEGSPPLVSLVIGAIRESVSLVDLAPGVRMRTLALATHDAVLAAREASLRAAGPPDEATGARSTTDDTATDQAATGQTATDPAAAGRPAVAAAALDREAGPTPAGAQALRAPTSAAPSSDDRARASGPRIALGARIGGAWLALRVLAPTLAIDGELRFRDVPIAIHASIDGSYAVGVDGIGEVRGGSIGASLGASVRVELAPVTLSLAAAVLAGYARADGIASSPGASGGAIEGLVTGIDVDGRVGIALGGSVMLRLALGFRAYLVGIEGRAEDRPVISYRDVAPTASLGIAVDLPER